MSLHYTCSWPTPFINYVVGHPPPRDPAAAGARAVEAYAVMTERLLMARRAGRIEHTPESEPVLVSTEGEVVVLVLDDGERLELDRAEIHAATEREAA